MTASERITLLKQIANELQKEGSWSIIDLTLKQFEIPTLDNFSGNHFEYILQQIQFADDEAINDLAVHLKINFSNAKSEITPSFWRDGYFNLFISHLASDKISAHDLKNKLEGYSISGFVAHSDIEPTKEWQDEIELALRTCDALVALMIPGFHESKWTDQEIGLALGRDLLIMPVRMGQDPYGFIGKFQAINFTDIDKVALDIFESLLRNKKTSKKIAQGVLHKFENSGSFRSAKINMTLVEKIGFWDKNSIERLKSAVQNNSQISDSFGVSSRVNSIVDRFENPT
jgi:hypothetical protein